MKALALSLVVFALALPATASAQPNKTKPEKKTDPPRSEKKEDDLPDVSFQIPEETSSEMKAVLRDNALRLFDNKAAERIKAAQVLGELGEQGKPVRIVLCRAMLDSDANVRMAAADALKSIDPKMQFLAVALVTEDSAVKRQQLLQKIKKLEDDGAPLSPLIAHFTLLSAAEGKGSEAYLIEHLTTLSSIARKDFAACQMIAAALDNKSPSVRLTALKELPRMKHGKLYEKKVIVLLNADVVENRIAAINALAALADESTEEVLAAAIAGQRYHQDERVRKAVEIGLNQLQNKAQDREKNSANSQNNK